MKIFNFGKKKETKKVMGDANKIMTDIILQKALDENKEKENKIKNLKIENERIFEDKKNLERNIDVLNNTIKKIKEICNNSNGKVVSKAKILKELGE